MICRRQPSSSRASVDTSSGLVSSHEFPVVDERRVVDRHGARLEYAGLVGWAVAGGLAAAAGLVGDIVVEQGS